jgi:hypothetical protein
MSEVTTTAPVADVSSAATTEGAVESKSEAVEVKTPPASQKEKFKFKIDGEEIEEEYDLSDKERLRTDLQLSKAAKKRMAEAQADKRKAFEIIQKFEADPKSMLQRLGPKGRAIAEEYLLSQIQDEMLTPEQKELRDLKKQNETYKEKEEREKKEAEEKVLLQRETEYAQKFQDTIIQALSKSSLPKTPEMVKRMAGMMKKNLEFGLELTPDELAAEVKSDLTSIFKSVVADADGDQLIALFGADVANKIRKSDLKRLTERQSTGFQPGKPEGGAPVVNERRPMTMEEFMAQADQRAGIKTR